MQSTKYQERAVRPFRYAVRSLAEKGMTLLSIDNDLFSLRAFGATDMGLKREANEDAFLVAEQQGLFVVSDGMRDARAGGRIQIVTRRNGHA